MPAALRLIHPAPALAVTLLSGVLGAILLGQTGSSPGWRLLLTAAAVAGSQITTPEKQGFIDAMKPVYDKHVTDDVLKKMVADVQATQ